MASSSTANVFGMSISFHVEISSRLVHEEPYTPDSAPTSQRTPHGSAGYQLLMLVLCIYALGVLAVQTAVKLRPDTRDILDLADYAVCVIFFVDFLIDLWRAPNRQKYFFSWGWLDLVSSIPIFHITRWARAARVVRIFRLLRGLRAARILTVVIVRRRVQSVFLAASLVALLLVIFSSIAVLTFETAPESNIKSAEDAVWWAFATITTVGYGDRYPVTSEGRFVAAILMCSGVGLFGSFSGLLAAWFVGPSKDETASVAIEVRALRLEVERLRGSIEIGRNGPTQQPP
jgi:voltage-gated potassium channel